MQNADVSFETHQSKIRNVEKRLELLIADEADAESIQIVRDTLGALRMQHHPDHWFLDPGAGKDTEEGRLRRRALQACWADCPMKARLLCLDRGLEEGPTLQYGIYGGRTEKDRQHIVSERKKHEEAHKKSAPASTR